MACQKYTYVFIRGLKIYKMTANQDARHEHPCLQGHHCREEPLVKMVCKAQDKGGLNMPIEIVTPTPHGQAGQAGQGSRVHALMCSYVHTSRSTSTGDFFF